jgi:hypothetical protein
MRFCLLLIALSAICGRLPLAPAAMVPLSSLNDPTLQTLIDLSSDGVTVGPLQFYDFTFLASPTSAPPTAASIDVNPVTNPGDGLQFVSAWSATGGNSVTDVISYRVVVVDPTKSISSISLFCDGTAPVPATGAFVSTSLSARIGLGSVAGRILNTFDDGVTKPVDTTFPDFNTDSIDFPAETSLSITQSISANSGSTPSTGVAFASTVENTFDPVPLPTPGDWSFVPLAIFAASLRLRVRRPILRSAL